MTTITMNSAAFSRGASFTKPSFATIRAAFPGVPVESSIVARTLNVAAGVAMAAVPFTAIVWTFVNF